MNRRLEFFLIVVLSLSAAFVLAARIIEPSRLFAQNAVDGTNPRVLTGFKTISESELQDGWLHLFDGKTLFGWDVVPLKRTKKAGLPNPVLKIANGELCVNSPTPIRLQTPLETSNRPEIVIDFRVESAVCDVKIQGRPLDEFSRSIVRGGMNGGFSTQRISLAGINDPTQISDVPIVSQPLADSEANGLLTIDVQGTFVVEAIRYRPRPTKSLNFRPDDSGDWILPAENDQFAVSAIDDATFRLSGLGRLESKDSFANFCARFEFRPIVDPANRAETFCNSGFFFRCVPGSSLDGYECQLDNVPNDVDRSKFLGNDSGSIFRRAAARRLTDRENEWTYLTVLARGASFRTWVNGIPALVWKDDRKIDENPRKGLRLEEGTIQLQGHDSWTKIEFRNILIESFPSDGDRP